MSNIANLPFVAETGKGKKKTRIYWCTRPAGNYYDECLLGQARTPGHSLHRGNGLYPAIRLDSFGYSKT